MKSSSDVSGYYLKTREERIAILARHVGLDIADQNQLYQTGSLDYERANKMIENAIGTFPLPLGIATHFLVNEKEYLVPMATEEASVIAAASNGAKLARPAGGFRASGSAPIMIAQIQLVQGSNDIDWKFASRSLLENKESLLNLANTISPGLKKLGGGAVDLEVRQLETKRGPMLIVHLFVDVRDSMGANTLNRMAEGITPKLESLTTAKARLRILSNLAVRRTFRAEAIWTSSVLEASVRTNSNSQREIKMTGDEIIEAILDAWAFADADPFRATTNNKGVMNGVDAVVLATGNDVRAVESAAHAYAAYNSKQYSSLTYYEKTPDGHLRGVIELPLPLGIKGGVTQTHPMAKLALKILNCESSHELGCVISAVGLAQNFAALRALATEGISRGHMRLHAKNLAIAAGADGDLIDTVAHLLVLENNFSLSRAQEIVKEMCNLL